MQCSIVSQQGHIASAAGAMAYAHDRLLPKLSTDSFQNLLANHFYELPDVARPSVSANASTKEPLTRHESSSDTEQRRDVQQGLTAATLEHSSHQSSGAGSEHATGSTKQQTERSKGRGRGRQQKRVNGQQETAQQRAHRRFYERKKQKLAALEEEASEKVAEYQRLLQENAELKRRHDALQRTIAGRDEQMSLMQALSNLTITSVRVNNGKAGHSGGSHHLQHQISTAPLPSDNTVQDAGSHSMQQLPLLGIPQETATLRNASAGLLHQQQQPLVAAEQDDVGPFGAVQLMCREPLPLQGTGASALFGTDPWSLPLVKAEPEQPQQHLVGVPIQQAQQQLQEQEQEELSLGAMLPGLSLTRSFSLPAKLPPAEHVSLHMGATAAATTASPAQLVVRDCTQLRSCDQHSFSELGAPTHTHSAGVVQQHGSATASIKSHLQSFTPFSISAAADDTPAAAGLPLGWSAGLSSQQQVPTGGVEHAPQQQQQHRHQLQPLLPGRPHSWSGHNSSDGAATGTAAPQPPAATAGVQRSAASFPSAQPPPHLMQQQQWRLQQQDLQEQDLLPPIHRQAQQQQQVWHVSGQTGEAVALADACAGFSDTAPLAPGVLSVAAFASDSAAAAPVLHWHEPAAVQQPRRGFHTVTTAGPLHPVPQQQHYQQPQEQHQYSGGGSIQRSGPNTSLALSHQMLLQEHALQQQQPRVPSPLAVSVAATTGLSMALSAMQPSSQFAFPEHQQQQQTALALLPPSVPLLQPGMQHLQQQHGGVQLNLQQQHKRPSALHAQPQQQQPLPPDGVQPESQHPQQQAQQHAQAQPPQQQRQQPLVHRKDSDGLSHLAQGLPTKVRRKNTSELGPYVHRNISNELGLYVQRKDTNELGPFAKGFAGAMDDEYMFDDDLMEMLEKTLSNQTLSQQLLLVESNMLLSPLPSLPSPVPAELTIAADAAVAAVASEIPAAVAVGGAGGASASSLPAAATCAATSSLHFEQPIAAGQATSVPAESVSAAGAAAAAPTTPAAAPTAAVVTRTTTGTSVGNGLSGGPWSPELPRDLLTASQQLQARHQAAGFCFEPAGPAEFFYTHQLVEWYKSMLCELSDLLPLVDRPQPDVAAGVAVVQLVEEVLTGIRKFAARNRAGLWELKVMNLETGEVSEPPSSHWHRTLQQVPISAALRDQSLACYAVYVECLEKVKQERRQILQDFADLEAELAEADAAAKRARAAAAGTITGSNAATSQQEQQQQDQALQWLVDAPTCLQFRRDGFEQYHALLDLLHKSMQREHMVCNMLMYSLSQGASHMQMAKAMLACWPFWPEATGIMGLMQEDEKGAAAPSSRHAQQQYRGLV